MLYETIYIILYMHMNKMARISVTKCCESRNTIMFLLNLHLELYG